MPTTQQMQQNRIPAFAGTTVAPVSRNRPKLDAFGGVNYTCLWIFPGSRAD